METGLGTGTKFTSKIKERPFLGVKENSVPSAMGYD